MRLRPPTRTFVPREGSFALPRTGRRTLFRVESGPKYDPQSHSVVEWGYTQLDGWQRLGTVAIVWCDGFDRAAVRDTCRRLARRAQDLEAAAEAAVRAHGPYGPAPVVQLPPPADVDDRLVA